MSIFLRYNSPIDFRAPQVPPPGTPKEYYPTLKTIYDSLNALIQALCQYCGIGPRVSEDWPVLAGSSTTLLSGNLRRFYCKATENFVPGAVITLYNNAGTIAAKNATAIDGNSVADGFSPAAVISGDLCEVILTTGVLVTTGLTVGARYWLGVPFGSLSPTPAVAAGQIEQYIGLAIDATHLYVEIAYPIQH